MPFLRRYVGFRSQEFPAGRDISGVGGEKNIPDTLYNKILKQVIRGGARVLQGIKEVEDHLRKVGASTFHIGECILLRRNATIFDVLEKTYHFKQIKKGMFNEYPDEIQNILMEIAAKRCLISVSKKNKIPAEVCELSKIQIV